VTDAGTGCPKNARADKDIKDNRWLVVRGEKQTMAVITDIDITLEQEILKRALGSGPSVARLTADIEWAVEAINRNIHPKAVYDYFRVTDLESGRVRLAGDSGAASVVLTLGPKADLLARAESAMVSVTTLGEEIDVIRRDLREAKADLRAYVWDVAGVLGLGLVGNEIKHMAEHEAAGRGWGVGRRLGPGDLRGWDLEEQRLLCSLLPIETIGVKMTSGIMLSPVKSASSVIGLGPAYEETEVGSICHWCRNRKTCPIRWLEEPADVSSSV
jgi:hypothetical protein